MSSITVTVDVDVADIIEDISTEDLQEELSIRDVDTVEIPSVPQSQQNLAFDTVRELFEQVMHRAEVGPILISDVESKLNELL